MDDMPALVRTYCEALKARNVDRIARTLADDLTVVLPARTLSKEQYLALLRGLYTGFPDWSYEHEAPEVRGEVIAIRWRQGGTHTGTFTLPGLAALPATGRTVRIPWHYFFYRVRGERIVEVRPETVPGGAPGGILEQLGIALPPL